MQLTREQLNALYELTVVSDDGQTLGPVGHIYLDDRTQQAVWVTAKTGLFGFREVFAPFFGARIEPDTLKVRYTKDYILDAPRIDSDGHITEEEQEELFRYFRVRRPDPADPAAPSAAQGKTEVAGTQPPPDDDGGADGPDVAPDTQQPPDDDGGAAGPVPVPDEDVPVADSVDGPPPAQESPEDAHNEVSDDIDRA